MIPKITCIFCTGHAGVEGNEHVDKLAGEAAIYGNHVLLDPIAFVSMVASQMSNVRNSELTLLHPHTLLTVLVLNVSPFGHQGLTAMTPRKA